MAKKKHSPEDRQAHLLHEALERSATMSEEELAYVRTYVALLNQYQELAATNRQREEDAANGKVVPGASIRLDPVGKLQTYVHLLAEAILPSDTIERLGLEVAYESQIRDSLIQSFREARARAESIKRHPGNLLLPDGERTDGGIVIPGNFPGAS